MCSGLLPAPPVSHSSRRARQAMKCWCIGIDDQATGIQRAGAGRNSPKCRLGFVSPTLSHHQMPNKNACEGCASSLGKHSSELWWPQHTHSPAATDAAIQKWTQKTLVHVSHVKQQEGKKKKKNHKNILNYTDCLYFGRRGRREFWNLVTETHIPWVSKCSLLRNKTLAEVITLKINLAGFPSVTQLLFGRQL